MKDSRMRKPCGGLRFLVVFMMCFTTLVLISAMDDQPEPVSILLPKHSGIKKKTSQEPQDIEKRVKILEDRYVTCIDNL